MVKVIKPKSRRRELLVLGALMHDSSLLHATMMWAHQHQDDLFLNDGANKLVEWSIDYYNKNGEAPGTDMIRVKYQEPWDEKTGGSGGLSEQVEAIRLASTSAWAESRFKKDQLYDIAEEVFRRQQVLIASDRMGGSSSAQIITDIIPGATPVTLAREPEYDSFFDDPRVAKDVSAIAQPLFTFKNEVLTRFFDDSFAAATFSAFIAPEKRGKSQWLLELTLAALTCGKRVLYFDAGDMTEEQIFLRFAARYLNKPYKPGPRYIWRGLECDRETLIPDFEEVDHEHAITQEESNRAKKALAKAAKGRFFSRNYPRGMLTVHTIRSILDSLSMRGVEIDVLIVDYADILGASKTKYQDNRFAITEIWGDLRTLSQSYNLALITATQANASAYTEELSEKSYSESKTKRAFITSEIGIDKVEGHDNIFKLSYTFRRTGTKSRSIYVGSDLATYQPACQAIWVPKKLDERDSRPERKFRKTKK